VESPQSCSASETGRNVECSPLVMAVKVTQQKSAKSDTIYVFDFDRTEEVTLGVVIRFPAQSE
jgi:hypothetical protein